jgi:hypothetical protein
VNATASGTTAIDLAQSITTNGSTTTTDVDNDTQAITLNPAPTGVYPGSGQTFNVYGTVAVVQVPNQPPFDSVPTPTTVATVTGGVGVLYNPATRVGLQTATPNTVAFSTAAGDAITVTDSDYAASGPAETTTVTVTGTGVAGSTGVVGTLTATAAGGATVSGTGTASLIVTGSPAGITSTLNSLVYTPGAGFFGTTTVTVSTDDNGNSGYGGPQTDTRTTSVTVVGLFLSEIDLVKGNTTNPSQYVEVFSTAPSYPIPSGVYLVGINGAAGTSPAPGAVTDIFNLNGFTTGTNGYLALLEKGEKYNALGDEVSSGTADDNIGTSAGFGNGGATSKFGSITGVHTGGTRPSGQLATDILTGAESFLLIETATAPTTSVNIDPASTGNPANQATAYTSWNVLDSVGILATTSTSTSHSYGAITFKPSAATGTTLSGSNVVSTGSWTATYVGRDAQNTGSSSADWLASVPTGTPTTGYSLGSNSTEFGGSPLNNVGGPNYWTPEETVVVNDGSSSQHSQVAELTVTFSQPVNIANLGTDFQVVDAAGQVLSTTATDNNGVSSGSDSGVTSVVITFNAGSVDSFSLAEATYTDQNTGTMPTVVLNNGNYFLNTTVADITGSSSGIELDGAHDGIAGSTTAGSGVYGGNGVNEVDEFWRLFGDTLGHRLVNGQDLVNFRAAYGSSLSAGNPNYAWYLDANGDGVINGTDNTAFQADYTKKLNA